METTEKTRTHQPLRDRLFEAQLRVCMYDCAKLTVISSEEWPKAGKRNEVGGSGRKKDGRTGMSG